MWKRKERKKETNKQKTTPQNNNPPNNPPQKEKTYKEGKKIHWSCMYFTENTMWLPVVTYPLTKCSLWPTPLSLVISFDEMFPVTYPLVPWYVWLRIKVKTDSADAFRWFCAHSPVMLGHWLLFHSLWLCNVPSIHVSCGYCILLLLYAFLWECSVVVSCALIKCYFN